MLNEPLPLYVKTRRLYESERTDWAESTKNHIIKFRKWIIKPDLLDPIINPKGYGAEPYPVRYIPDQMGDGFENGGYFFPIYDPEGYLTLAQIRWNTPERHGSKTLFLGYNAELCGPKWCGMDPYMAKMIQCTRKVLIVEGPFDWLACKVCLNSDFPVLSPFGSHLTRHHIQDLSLLGVIKVILMFDNDSTGKVAAIKLKENLPPFAIDRLVCPATDPSDCLTNEVNFKTLVNLLKKQCGNSKLHHLPFPSGPDQNVKR
jgi:5S rRNA maturation endonuclease (ribonuclease M5)